MQAAGALALNLDTIATDNTVNIAEKAAGFAIGGDTGSEAGVTVSVTIGTESPLTATSAAGGAWSVDVPADAAYLTGASVAVTVSASKTGFTSPGDVMRTLAVDLTAPAASYTAPGTLKVGVAIGAMTPSTTAIDIASYGATGLPSGLGIDSTTGAISGTPDTADANTADATVTVTDRAGNPATVSITFPAVANDDTEAPDAPGAPSVSAASVTSLNVTWSAPDNDGPEITDYDYRYRTTSPQGTWVVVMNTTITARSTTIGSLQEYTSYDVQVRATNDEGTSGWSASGSGTTAANAAPSFTSSTTFTPAENQTAVGTVVASDNDAGDDITGYALSGGADAGFFSIGPTSGALTFDDAPNFEDAQDQGADNAYEVTVQATSGTGDREQTGTQTITVTVTDADEQPDTPAKPTVTSGTTDSLDVTWTAPGRNGGPAIIGYGVEFRVVESLTWRDWTHTGSATTTTITGLTASTEYQVQVQALNGETPSAWSDPSVAVPTNSVTNNAPVFSETALTRVVPENLASGQNVGDAVTADDAEGDTLEYTLEGTDASSFDIVSTSGQIQTKSGVTYDYEATKNSYEVAVKASDGTASATIAVIINVTDVDEQPDKPAKPTLAAVSGSTTSLDVSWTEPGLNGGPELTGYNVEYREGTSGDWENVTHSGTGTTTTITGLTASTEYQVRVQALNGETPSAWSDPSVAVPTNSASNNAPVFSETAPTRVVPENLASDQNVGDAVTATDADPGDTLTYTLEGTDVASFDIVSTSGQIQTKTGVTYDHEEQSSYSVTVRASDGTASATIDVEITVTDEDERPDTPAKPTVSATSGTTDSLDVTWAEPGLNGGPAITGYTVEYREGTSGTWLNFSHPGTAVTTTLTGLTADTPHQARVQAVNGETDSEWSDPSDAVSTNAEPLEVTLHLSGEDAGAVTVTATVSPASATAFTVTVSASPVAPATDDDFALSTNRELRFAANATASTGTVTIRLVNDDVLEPTDVVTVSGSASIEGVTGPDDVTLTILDDDLDRGGICARTPRVRDRILVLLKNRHSYKGDCSGVNEEHLAELESLDLGRNPSTESAFTMSLQSDDFEGLVNLERLYLRETGLGELPAGVFSGLAALETLELDNNQLSSLPAGVFSDLQSLKTLELQKNPSLSSLPYDEFEALPNLTELLVDPEGRRGYQVAGGEGDATLEVAAGGTTTYQVRLTHTPAYVGTASLPRLTVSSDTDGVVATPATLRFTKENWFRRQTVTVDAQASAAGATATLNHTSTGVTYDRPIPTVTVRVLESDTSRTADPLTADFQGLPSSHDGETAFSFRIAFSEAVSVTPEAMRTRVLTVAGGAVTGAARVDGESGVWSITVAPDSREALSITLAPAAECAADGAVCTSDGRALSTGASAIVNGPGPESQTQEDQALTASFEGVPEAHDGERAFRFHVAFSEDIGIDDQALRDDAFTVSGGAMTGVRGVDGRHDRWEITVAPDSDGDVTITLPAGRACEVSGAICTTGENRRRLSNSPSATVAGPADEPESNTAAAGAPTISGTAQVGEALTASTSGVADADGLDTARFAYQWIRTSADIGGATRSTYTPVAADEGTRLQVRVSFTDDAGHEERLTSAATDAVAAAPEPLTASFEGMPAEHRGQGSFSFRVAFSEGINISYTTVRDASFTVTGGEVTQARRVDGRRDRWKITIEPDSHEAVTVRLPETTDCGASGAICTGDGRPLSHALSATVAGPVGIAVADARVDENSGALLAFAVTLSRAASAALTVDYATADGSAHAGDDYTATSGTLKFRAGESSKTIEVAVLDDAHDEGEETLTLRLSNPSGGRLADGEATGTIANHDSMPRALLARFGRTAAVHVVEHVEERLAAPRAPGFRGRFAGRELRRGMERDIALNFLRQLGGAAGAGPMGAGAGGPLSGAPATGTAPLGMSGLAGDGRLAAASGPMGMVAGPLGGGSRPDSQFNGGGLVRMGLGGGDVLTGSAFELGRETGHGGILSFWSRGARSRFSGREGALSLGGDVRTTMVGADYATGPLVTGLSLSHSRGPGRVHGVRRRPGGLVGDGPVPVARLPGDRPRHGVGRGGVRRRRAAADAAGAVRPWSRACRWRWRRRGRGASWSLAVRAASRWRSRPMRCGSARRSTASTARRGACRQPTRR